MIKSRPYHPQSQGKVERSHRSLKKKIMYDFINLGEKGVNWASNLASYSRILNEESKEELGWKSPFQVYFGRKSNILVKASLENMADLNDCIMKAPKRKDYRRHFKKVKKLRERAQLYSKRMNERMVRRHARLHNIPAYKRGDEVFVRYRQDRRGSITPKRRIVLKGTVLKKSKTNSMFKARMVPPGSNKEIEKWLLVEDITNAGLFKREKGKKMEQDRKRNLKQLRKKLYIPMTQKDHFETFSSLGFHVVYNPNGDGKCQFEALRFWLQTLGIYRSVEAFREEIVQYLTQNPDNVHGTPLENFAAMPWDRFLASMAQNGEYEDQITLQAVAEIFNIDILVVSSLGPDATAVIAPTSSIPMAQIRLGHFAEGHGEHYVCVEGDFQSDEQGIEDIDHQLLENRPEEEQEPQKSQKSENSSKTHEYKLQNYQCERTVKSEVQIRFVPSSTLITNNLIRSGNNSQNIVSMEILPRELIDMIIKMEVYSSGLSGPNHICRVDTQIYNVNRLFRACIKKLLNRLPRIYFPSGELGYVSIAKLIRQYGSGSGLLLEIKQIISHPRWNRAWLKLYADANGWFIILKIIWRKGYHRK